MAANVTFLLTDVPGTTARWEAAPDETAAALARLDDSVEAVAAALGGTLVKPRGENDSHFLVFEDPPQAVAAAVRLGLTVVEGGLLPIRMAVTLGEAEHRDGDWFGPVINHCARLRAAAHAGQIVLGEAVVRATASSLPDGVELVDLGWHWLKDLERPLHAWGVRHPRLPRDLPALRSLAPPAPDVPLPLTSFVDRAEEIAAVTDAVARPGAVVTIRGAPGVGKSRVAMEVAAALRKRGQVDVRWATVGDGPLPVLGAPVMPTLVVLDDVDLALDDVPGLVDALLVDPLVAVLATARRAIGMRGEIVVHVPPLPWPDAVDLLRARAAAARPGLEVPNETAVEVVTRLCGLPLAIELAAARLAVLTPRQLAARLAEPTRVLTARSALPERHRSLAETIDWTRSRLEPSDRADLAALAAGEVVSQAAATRLLATGWAEPGPDGPTVLPLLAAFVLPGR